MALPIYPQRRAGRDDSAVQADLQRGIQLTRSGKFREAIPIFQGIQGKIRDEYAVSFNLALCYVATGQFKPAIDLLDGIRSAGKDNANVENLLAQALLGNREPEAAFAAFERGARLAPKDEKFYLYLVESCMDSGYHDVGLRIVEIGLRHLPRSARLVFEHGMLLAQLDFLDDAKKELQKVSKLTPGSDVAYIAAAQKSLFEGNVVEAVRVAREGIRKGAQHFMLLALYGAAIMDSGAEPGSQEFDEARAALEQAVALRPTYASAQLALGKLNLLEGRLQDAVERLNTARDLDPRNVAVYSNLAAAYRRQGENKRAEEALAILARLNQEEVEHIRLAPGDRKPGYVSK
jgi:tetratricopeptide (TPR) repeat protein